MTKYVITDHRVHHPKRYPGYPSNGLMLTKHQVILNGDKTWRRVYERWDLSLPPISKHVVGRPVALVKIKEERIDLTPDQCKQIGWRD